MAKQNQHYFGEQQFESGCEVWQTPKFQQARQKAIEMIDCGKYGLTDGDFWILMNKTRSGKMAYSGLIISHNGCLKVNDALEPERRFNPRCVTKDINDYGGSLTFTYVDDEIYEIGEVSASNCKNAYPLAMAFKRCFDRVVLKKSKLAYAGVYSEEESEEFAYQQEVQPVQNNRNYPVNTVQAPPIQNQPIPQQAMPQQQMVQRPMPQPVVQAPAQQYAPPVQPQQPVQASPQMMPQKPVAGGAATLQNQPKVTMSLKEALNYRVQAGAMRGHPWGELVSHAESRERVTRALMFYANSMSGKEQEAARVVLDALNRHEIEIIVADESQAK